MASVCVVYLGGLFHSSEEPEFAGFDFWLYSVSFLQTRVELEGLACVIRHGSNHHGQGESNGEHEPRCERP